MSYFTAQVSCSGNTTTQVVAEDTMDRFVYLGGTDGSVKVSFTSTDATNGQFFLATESNALANGFVLPAGLGIYVHPSSSGTVGVLVTKIPSAQLGLVTCS